MAIIRSTNSPYELAIDNNLGARVNLYDAAGSALASTGGALNVNVSGGAIDVGTTDRAAFVYGASAQQPIGGVFQDTSPSVVAGESGAIRMTSQRGMHTNLRNSSGNELLGQMTSALSLPVVIASDQPPIPAVQSGTWNINNITGTISLPTGAATEATVSALSAKFNSLGQKTSAASAPVVLASDQSPIPVSQSGSWTVTLSSGSIEIGTVDQGTPNTIGNAWPVRPTDGVNSQTYTASGEAKVLVTPLTNSSVVKAQLQDNAGLAVTLGQKAMASSLPVTIASDQSPLDVAQSGTWNIDNVTGTVSLPTNAAQEAGGHLESIDAKLGTGPVAQDSTVANVQGSVTGGTAATKSSLNGGIFNTSLPTLTSGQQSAMQLDSSGRLIIRPLTSADVVTADQGGSWDITNITGTVSLPTNAAQETGGNLDSLNSKFNSLGQKTMAASAPVVIASDQSPIPAVQSGTWNINNIVGTVSLPTNAAQESGGHLASIDAKLGTGPTAQDSTVANVQGSVTGGVAASKSDLIGGQFNTALPTLTSGQQSAIQVDSNARLIIRPLTSVDVVTADQGGIWNITNITGTVSLPTGAATEATLAALNAKFNSLGQKASAASAPVVIASDQSAIPVSQSGTWTVELASESIEIGTVDQGTPNTIANAWPVKPTDGTNSQTYTASGESKVLVTPLTNASVVKAQLQDNAGTAITLGQKVSASSVPVVLASDQSSIPVAATQSGTWNINNVTGTVSLPTNAAQEAGGHLASIDAKLGAGPTAQDSTVANVQGSVSGGTAALKSDLIGAIFNTALPTLTSGQQSSLQLDSSGRLIIRPLTSADVVSAVQSGTWNITNITGTVSLPTNAAQESGGHLASLDSKFNSLGQKAGAASAPVVIASDQSAIPVSQSGTWTVALSSESIEIGTVDQGTPNTIANAWPVLPTDGTHSQTFTAAGEAKVLVTPLTNSSIVKAQLQDNAGTAITLGQKVMASSVPVAIASDQSAIPASQSGTWNINNVTGTVSLPTNAAQETGGHLASIDTKLGTGPVSQDSTVANVQGSVSGGTAATKSDLVGGIFNTAFPTLTSGQQSSLQLDSSGRLIIRPLTSADVVTANQGGTWNINNITGTVSLPTGAATEATLAALSAKFNSLGQKTMAASAPVVLASDQSAIPVSQSGTWNINNVSGTVSLPTNAAQETGGHLASIDAKLGTGPTAQDATVANVQGSVSGGTAATKSDLIGGVFNTAFPTLTSGQQAAMQLDSSGRLVIRPLTSADVVSAVQSGTWNITNITGAVSLPTNAAQETGGHLASLDAKFNSLGQKTSANSAPVVIASDQSAIPASQSGTWNINNVTGTVSLPTNAAQETGGHLASIDAKLGTGPTAQDSTLTNVQGSASGGTAATKSNLVGGIFDTALPTLTNGQQCALQIDSSGRLITRPLTAADVVSAVQSGTWTVQQGGAPWADNLTQVGGSAISLGQKTSANSLPVVIASDQSAVPVSQSGSWTVTSKLQDGAGNNITSQASGGQRALDVGVNVGGVQIDPRAPYPGTIAPTSVTATNTSSTLLAANSSRKFLVIQNTTGQNVWVSFGGTATAAAPSMLIAAGSSFSMEGNFVSTQQITVIRGGGANATLTVLEGT